MKERLKILILTEHPFPYGLAQTNRLFAVAKGMIETGSEVKVVCTKPTEIATKVRNKEPEGMFEDVPFVYSSNITIRENNPVKRLYRYYYGRINSLRLIIKENKKNKVDVVFSSYRGLFISVLVFILSRVYKIKLLHERSEYPFLGYSSSSIEKLKLLIYQRMVCKLFDGFIIITHALKVYFEELGKKRAKYFILPILVDPNRFNKKRVNNNSDYIAYCGSMQGEKDGVPILIEAFKLIQDKFPNLKLYLIGETKFRGFDLLQKKIESLKLEQNIIFTGRIERNQLPEYLINAKALTLSRPDNKQAEGGFPTKLGEYLASGRPVVVTNVGEISKYLTDGENAYIAEPNNSTDFANKLEHVLINKERSDRIGLNGKRLAHGVFNYKVQGERLTEWLLTEILNNKR